MLAHFQEKSLINLPSTHHAGPRFKLGRIFATPDALEVIAKAQVSIIDLLIRHVRGDWGELSESDRQQNELSIEAGLRLLSNYHLPDQTRILVITEWDRSHTTIERLDEVVITSRKTAPARR
ncbi:hypothetical protein LIG30_2844 [Burkholderia sp. lig30]|nr:hypothetical protein LIG30_2844 [Burkholderia sp. lig30]